MHLSSLIYSVVFYLISLSVPFFPHALLNAGKILLPFFFFFLYIFNRSVMNDFGRFLKMRIGLL